MQPEIVHLEATKVSKVVWRESLQNTPSAECIRLIQKTCAATPLVPCAFLVLFPFLQCTNAEAVAVVLRHAYENIVTVIRRTPQLRKTTNQY